MRRFLMDCDTGGDDTSAIALAVASHDIQLLGVTTCMGNRPLEQTYRNTREVIKFLGADVPVAKGSEHPLKREYWVGNAEDSYLPIPGLTRDVVPAIDKDAVEFMADVLRNSNEKITLIPLAPLTNIAKLMLFYPDLVEEKVDEIIIMGGGMYFGNTTGAAELNIYADPEAAAAVFSFGKPIVMCGLDVCYNAKLYAEDYEELKKIPTKAATAFAGVIGGGLERRKELGFVLMYDSLPVIYALHPEIFTGLKASIQVETSGELTYGQTVCDTRNDVPANKKIHTVVLYVDREAYLKYVKEILANSDY